MNSFFPTFVHAYCKGTIERVTDRTYPYDIVIKGTIENALPNSEIRYVAASPADRRATYTGSGLPFHNEKQAFDNTPNSGKTRLSGISFKIPLLFPNAYHVDLGNQLIPPTLYINYIDSNNQNQTAGQTVAIKLGDPIPYRFLEYPSQPFTQTRNGATFYHAHHNLPVRTQEQVLRDSQYPAKNIMAPDFWGLRPAL